MNSLFVLAAIVIFADGNQPPSSPLQVPHNQVAVMCSKSGEQVSGTNKICYNNRPGSQAAITISAVQLCPLSIDR